MYAVVGCSECSALKILKGRPDTTECPRCGKRHKYEKLKKFVETDDEDHAREVRSSMLANRQGEGETFAEMDSFAEMEDQIDDAGMGEAEFLQASGLDDEEVAAAGERAESGRAASGASNRKETVLAALRELDQPTEADVIAYADEQGVSAEYVRKALDKLTRRGEVSESRGRYRLL
ncbi:DUF5817 domain-containing protein [Halorussus halophilus]|uniref:DUF5817 domain-containing protein n=1 Tax=Halorussus halophilus TaxID=2650975 RepID=UPI001300F027|nr:DUF5817 domain-containing protein [Halorussus halophilus]